MTAAAWAGLAVAGGLGAIARFTVEGPRGAARGPPPGPPPPPAGGARGPSDPAAPPRLTPDQGAEL